MEEEEGPAGLELEEQSQEQSHPKSNNYVWRGRLVAFMPRTPSVRVGTCN